MAGTNELSQNEVNSRVAVLRRFKELLSAQRDRFASYLEALDKSKDVIEKGSAEELIRHVELEEKILGDIYSIQKVIDPLEEMYRSFRTEAPGLNAAAVRHEDQDDVPTLKSALEILGKEAAVRSERNRKMLSDRMTELRSEIKNLRANPFLQKRQTVAAPSLVDIRG